MTGLSIFIFTVIFLFVANYFQVITFSKLFIGPKIKTSTIIDSQILKTIKDKSGLVIKNIQIFHDIKPYAMMGGFYSFPILIISQEMYTKFSKEEMEWVILHEAGHHILWHNFIAAIIELSTIIFGIKLILLFNLNFIISGALSIFLALFVIQIIRYFIEYQADWYSINLVSNPKAVISAQIKLEGYYKKTLSRSLLSWNISPNLRIKLAELRLGNFRKD